MTIGGRVQQISRFVKVLTGFAASQCLVGNIA
jgi:hypothetical protein